MFYSEHLVLAILFKGFYACVCQALGPPRSPLEFNWPPGCEPTGSNLRRSHY